MIAKKKLGGNPSWALQPKVAWMLSKVGKEKQQLAHIP